MSKPVMHWLAFKAWCRWLWAALTWRGPEPKRRKSGRIR